MGGANGLRQFQILLYKGLLLRKRHYIVSFAEIIFPIIIACIPAMIISEGSVPRDASSFGVRDKSIWINYTTFPPFDPFTTIKYQSEDVEFVYTPSYDTIDKFMNDSLDMFVSKIHNYKQKLSKLFFDK
ncbi:hypothetical protein AVEN_236025-1 [Araneus ventricosus]|uniref:Uncharacterized protein n=1 Tax=Araneus ventricosus TaxID=182803 RepID=A0A4Y2LCD4_ARAVE|nr:hypothetical protein AVEN_236025-1 [Araneus ventricosus]